MMSYASQIVLITLVYLIVPRAANYSDKVNPDKQDTISLQAENLTNKIPEGQGHDAYVVVFDAGSTGTLHLTFTMRKTDYIPFDSQNNTWKVFAMHFNVSHLAGSRTHIYGLTFTWDI